MSFLQQIYDMFFNRRVIDREVEDWQIDAARWVIKNFGGLKEIRNSILVLPTKEHFPTNGEEGHALAEVLLSHVKHHAGMAEWPCELEAQAELPPGEVDEFIVQKFEQQPPMGTFRIDEGENTGDDEDNMPIISYDPALLTNPTRLISTLAHELAHYLMLTSPEPPPDGWELHEHATDFLAVFMGFGVFMANSAFHFEQMSDGFRQGFQSSGSGYLTENELVNALSLFLLLKDETIDHADEHLKPHLRSLLKRARKRHLKDDRIATLRKS